MAHERITFDYRDEFLTRPIAERMIRLISDERLKLSPIMLEGAWGTGKTEFCCKLVNLHKHTHPDDLVAYVDAFKADVGGIPIVTILAALQNLLPEEKAEAVRIAAIPVVKFVSKVGLKAGVGWLLRQDADVLGDELREELDLAAGRVIDSAVGELIDSHRAYEDSVEELRKLLAELAEERRVTIYIDELDRCRPNFALELLESIKHVFESPNVCFVLVANAEQLMESVRHAYGLKLRPAGYLDKFIKYRLSVPTVKTNADQLDRITYQHYLNLLEGSGLLANTSLNNQSYLQTAKELIEVNKDSLREIEAFVRCLETYVVLCDGFPTNIIEGYGLLRFTAIYLFSRRVDLASYVCDQPAAMWAPKVKEFLGVGLLEDPNDSPYWRRLECISLMLVQYYMGTSEIFKDSSDRELQSAWMQIVGSHFGGSLGRGSSACVNSFREAIEVMMLTRGS